MKKLLDTVYPVITTYTQHAHLLAILGTCLKAEPWVFSNYIQIYISKKLNTSGWADFYFPMPYETRPFEVCKWIEVQKNNENFLDKNHGDIVNYVKSLLENDYYVHMMVNYKYLSNSCYSKKGVDARHDILIYGYDDDTEILYCADFMFEANKYTFSKCTYGELKEAYNNDFVKTKPSYLNHNIYSYKLKRECDYEYHVENILYWIKQYINGDVPEYWRGYNNSNRDNIAWGMNYYDVLIQNLLCLEDHLIDVRFYCLLRDHKKIMIERLRFLENNAFHMKDYINLYGEIYSDMSIIVNLVIKYNIIKKISLIDKITEKLTSIKNKERSALEKIINYLERN